MTRLTGGPALGRYHLRAVLGFTFDNQTECRILWRRSGVFSSTAEREVLGSNPRAFKGIYSPCPHGRRNDAVSRFQHIPSLDMSTPNAPSPGPGWWMASDGNWYPQQWEYACCSEDGRNAMNHLLEHAARLGLEGWEMVGISTVQRTATAELHAVYAYFKRPIRPG